MEELILVQGLEFTAVFIDLCEILPYYKIDALPYIIC